MRTLIRDRTSGWLIVTQDPMDSGADDLIRFYRSNTKGKLLDRTARWLGTGWDPSRWVPGVPEVPIKAIVQVEQMLLQHSGVTA
jgi:hypothetical protein